MKLWKATKLADGTDRAARKPRSAVQACFLIELWKGAGLLTFALASRNQAVARIQSAAHSPSATYRPVGPNLPQHKRLKLLQKVVLGDTPRGWIVRPKLKLKPLRDTLPPAHVEESPKLLGFHGRKSCGIIYDRPEPLPSQFKQKSEEDPRRRTKMKSYVQIITTPTRDTRGTSLLLHFDNKRYLIGNIHEGTQRVCMQNKVGLNKVTDIFLTGKTEWKNLGGVMGMILSLADSTRSSADAVAEHLKAGRKKREARKKEVMSPKSREKLEKEYEQEIEVKIPQPKLTIHGGSNILHTLATGRRFIFRKGLPVDVNEYGGLELAADGFTDPTWSDENIRVWAIPIKPINSTSAVPSTTRKRSFDDYLGPRTSKPLEANDRSPDIRAQEARRIQLLRSVVSNMFDSDWRLDALIETPLEQAPESATLFVRNPVTKKIEKYVGPRSGIYAPRINVLVRRPWPGSLISELPTAKPSDVSMCYMVRNYPQRGKFLAEKAITLGIKPGPEFQKLTKGKSVLSADGSTVRPDQVMEPGKPGGGFVVAEIPSTLYLQEFVNLPCWNTPDTMEGVGAVVWILGPGVPDDRIFQEFVGGHNELQHIISAVDYSANYISMDSATSATIRHSLIDSDRYGVPVHDNKARPLPKELSQCVVADRGLTLHLEPSIKVESATIWPRLNTTQVVVSMPQEVMRLADVAQKSTKTEDSLRKIAGQALPSPDTEIIPLGTGSALPSKYRNVSATLVRVPGIGSYLFDCGENTLGQLSRIYKPEELLEVLCDIKLIWISHMHGDHHLGITSVISAWYKANYGDDCSNFRPAETPPIEEQVQFPAQNLTDEKRLFVLSAPEMIKWIQEYSMVEEIGYDKLVLLSVKGAKPQQPHSTVLTWAKTVVGFDTNQQSLNQAMRKATGLRDFAAAYVPHCYGAMGVALTFSTGFKISYSGDCRPSRSFVEIGQGSTVLIHEATFDDELQGDALAKKHSTTSEAIGVGVAMNARRILLTHFSQRYQKIPSMNGLERLSLQLEDANDAEDDPDAGIEISVAMTAGGDQLEQGLYAKHSGATQDKKIEVIAEVPQDDLKVAVAFDLMRVKVKDIALLDKFHPALKKLYEGVETSIEEETALKSSKVPPSEDRNVKKQKSRKSLSKPTEVLDVPAANTD